MPAMPENVSARPPARLAETRHLREPARDDPALRAVAQAEALDTAGRERDHVLRGAASSTPTRSLFT